MTRSDKLVEVKHLKKYFDMGKGKQLKAVDDVSFHILRGETFGLVGESGCGKSTTGRTMMRLYQRTAGQVLLDGEDVHQLGKKERLRLTKRSQMIFQDPYASLNPRSTIAEILSEPMDVHSLYEGTKRKARIHELLDIVGLSPDHANRYPHEFSGGQRQRIGIARALSVDPEFIIADEPISALDVSVQAQVVNLMKALQKERELTYLFIAHDLSMVKHISDRIGVMYLGHLVELTSSKELYRTPLHPYTQALLSAIPIPDPEIEDKRERIILKGEIPSPVDPPSGCVFRTRCPAAIEICAQHKPEWKEIDDHHYVACHLLNKEKPMRKEKAMAVHIGGHDND
ncbi:putative oligopeptide transport ATP-binding protein YkfD [Pullulanibacillus camelliae]|uniref:Putative oligopeptide transport ATP-binding protein YkfD n=1 Tax=Pullulanibacillus camelliae TaxID=1707096 RepID=A0A8J2YG23_9BACL|nr:oligopeptide/dipeptide ABC transporter ATP-binding protein [Pullulanibacillus camelliae]GGE32074.1 putative oligopeptide transport ATP-binding protein YkfD [Pullulanibacillus camelliae]